MRREKIMHCKYAARDKKNKVPALNICFMGGKQAGIFGLLTALSAGHKISSAVSYSDDLTTVLSEQGIPIYKSVLDKGFVGQLKKCDVLLSVHGREIVSNSLLKLPRLAAVNIHPFLYKYKGASPIERALKDGETRASVGAHIIGEAVDCGRILAEEFVDIDGIRSVERVYQKLYPYYCLVILKALKKVRDEKIGA